MLLKEIKTKAEDVKPKLMEHAAKAPKTAAKDLWLKFKEKSISEIKETICKKINAYSTFFKKE